MEGASKERITGAVILVAAMAIAVPELLSGPDASRDRAGTDAVAETGPPLTTYDLAINPASTPGGARQQELATSAARAQSEAIAAAVPPPVTAPARESLPDPAAAATPATVAPSPTPAQQASTSPAPAVAAPVTETRKPAARAPETASPAAAPAPAPATAKVAAAPAPAGRWWVQLGSFSSADNAQRLARDLRAKGFAIDVSSVKSNGKDLHRVRAGPEKDRNAATALRSRLAAAGQQGSLVAP